MPHRFFSPLFLRSPSLLYPPSQAASAWRTRPGTAAYAKSLPDRALSLESVDEATVVNNLFVGNKADGIGGGAICALDTSPVIVNNAFVENEATSSDAQRGFGGGVLFNVYSGSADGVLANNLFCNNVTPKEMRL